MFGVCDNALMSYMQNSMRTKYRLWTTVEPGTVVEISQNWFTSDPTRTVFLLWFITSGTVRPFFCLSSTCRIYEPTYDKTNKMTCAPSEGSDQPTISAANNKGVDQTAWVRRLICVFVVRIWQKQVFSRLGSFNAALGVWAPFLFWQFDYTSSWSLTFYLN